MRMACCEHLCDSLHVPVGLRVHEHKECMYFVCMPCECISSHVTFDANVRMYMHAYIHTQVHANKQVYMDIVCLRNAHCDRSDGAC